MMRVCKYIIVGVFAGLLLLAELKAGQNTSGVAGDAEGRGQSSHHIMAKGYYVRETEDTDWSFSVNGKITSMCGIYLIIYDANGKIIHQGVVPYGNYPPGRPYTIKIAKDGVVGDYKIKLIAAQEDVMGINLPLTNLKEVYEIQRTTIGHAGRRYLLFQVAPGQTELTVSAYKGHLRVKENSSGKVVADTSDGSYGGDKRGAEFRFSNYIKFAVKPGIVYRLEPQAFYFGFGGGTVYCMFRPDGWFLPEASLRKVKWWHLPLLSSGKSRTPGGTDGL